MSEKNSGKRTSVVGGKLRLQKKGMFGGQNYVIWLT